MSVRLMGLIGKTVLFRAKDFLDWREEAPPFKVATYVMMNGRKVGLYNANGDLVKVMPFHVAQILLDEGEILWCFPNESHVMYRATIIDEEEKE